jgi:hypothetical protein
MYLVNFTVTRVVHSHVIFVFSSFVSTGHDFYHLLSLADYARLPVENYERDGHVIF